MAFEQQQNITITGFEDISISLFIPGISNTEDIQSGEIEIQLALNNGEIKVITANLLERLGDDAPGLIHRTRLLELRDYILARISTEVLPTP
jgi:hypothetical protein